MEWLEFADVARLDSAYNNRELSRVFRGLLSSPLTLFDFSRFALDKREEKIRWAMKRQLHTIEMPSYVSEDVWSSIVLTSCLDRLRVLDIYDYSDMSDALLLPILNKCRNSLKELRFIGCDRGLQISARFVSLHFSRLRGVLDTLDSLNER